MFVLPNDRKHAYADAALPIGFNQTITSPFVVAYMTEKLEPQDNDKVLEIGTGSGYQASVLSQVVAEVYSIEIVEPLGLRAARTIERLGYKNVHTKIGDGYQGWPEHAPFDKIIVTCSPEKVPPALVQQLKEGGLLVVPLGRRFQQTLYLFRKVDGKLQQERLEATFFVPMTGKAEELRVNKESKESPAVVNGSFEDVPDDSDVTGWFYVRQAKIVADTTAPDGQNVLQLSNSVPGQKCHALQAISIDGREFNQIEMSVWARADRVSSLGDRSLLPQVELTFYGENRGAIRSVLLGPWVGNARWSRAKIKSAVPGRARFGTIVVGMFGPTGQFAIDQLSIRATGRRD